MKLWPKLYKKTSTGAIQEWTVGVRGHVDLAPAVLIYTWHGQVDGKIQETSDLISKGKNIGKKNETTPAEQGFAEAQSKWEKQKKKGYVESIEAAQNNELDALIEGGVVPMLAQKYSDHGHKITYPAYVQPKLDGIRCVAMIKNGKATLWSRTRKAITSMPHIIEELEKNFTEGDIILDGELYNHNFKANFEHIVSMVRQEEPDPRHTDVEYHIYDVVSPGGFEERWLTLSNFFLWKESSEERFPFKYLKPVVTVKIHEEEKVMSYFEIWREQGYEGAMLRNLDAEYVNKRSYDLQKVKEFDDEEFPIIGIEEGRGKLAGHVGAFVCKTQQGKTFLAKMSGDTSRLRDFFLDHSLWQNKILTVQYQGMTSYKVPRFPVGIAIRDYE